MNHSSDDAGFGLECDLQQSISDGGDNRGDVALRLDHFHGFCAGALKGLCFLGAILQAAEI